MGILISNDDDGYIYIDIDIDEFSASTKQESVSICVELRFGGGRSEAADDGTRGGRPVASSPSALDD